MTKIQEYLERQKATGQVRVLILLIGVLAGWNFVVWQAIENLSK